MLLSDHFEPGSILFLPEVRTRAELFPLLVRAIGPSGAGLDPEQVLSGVLEREARMPTSIGLGIAVPHARIAAAPGLLAAVGICPAGLDYSVPDGKPVRLAILLVSPPSAAGLHVRALAAVGRVSSARVADLLDSTDPDDFLIRWKLGESRASGCV